KIRMKYKACTELQKHFMLQMLIEIADPKKTSMQEPKGKSATKGRPTKAQTKTQKNKEQSTKRDPSRSERPPTGTTSTSTLNKVPVKAQEKAVMKSHIMEGVKNINLPDLNELPYLNEVDEQDVLPSKM
ncbi:hypothetical protein MKX01_037874, partial [Papaver californicum]